MRRFLLLSFTFLGSFALLVVMLILRPFTKSERLFFRASRWWGGRFLAICGVKLTVHRSAVALETPVIYICNHRSLIDSAVVLAGLDDSLRMMYKHELRSIPVFGWLLALSPFIAVNRAEARSAVASIDSAVEQIRSGGSVLLFPEGTWSETEELLPFKRGVVALAIKSGMQIVPIGISGSAKVNPPNTYKFNRGAITLRIGEPITHPDTNGDRNAEKEFVEYLRSRVAELVGHSQNTVSVGKTRFDNR